MKKKALRKDFFMEIKKSFPRFISIFFIVALGVAFYAGIRSAKTDMMISADKYYDETNLMDIKVISTLGLSDNDIKALSKVAGVKQAEGAYSTDLVCMTDDNSKPVIKVMSFDNEMNKVTLESGKLPAKDDECVIDSVFAEKMKYKLGDKIKLLSGTEDDISDTVKNTEFTITGIGNSSMYISPERGKSKVGTGKISGYMIINKDVFTLKAYTEAYITSKGALSEISYYDSYNDNVKETLDNIKKISSEREEARLTELKDEAEKKIADAESELEKSKDEADSKFADAKKKLDDGKAQIENGKNEIDENELQITLAKRELAANKAKIAESKKKIADGKTQCAEAEKTLSENEAKVQSGIDSVTAAINQLNTTEMPEDMRQQKLSELDKQLSSLEDNQYTLKQSRKQLEAQIAELNKGEAEITSSEAKIKNAEAELERGEAKIAQAKQKIASSETTLNENIKKYEEEKQNAEAKIADAEKKIAESKDKVNDIKKPVWYVFDRSALTAYKEYGDNADKIGAIGKVFPAIFFLVAALVSLTTMTRMVEEERTQIGTLKALGYSKMDIASKYILYAFIASTFGSILGFLVGEQIFPRIIIVSYRMMYASLPYVETPINWYYAVTASLLAIGCTTVVTILACYKELMSSPSSLMRPEAPKAGKRVLLERIPFIWNKLNFTQKSTLRNLLRYKKRFFMTTFGIAGCMGLLLVGYGIRDSISDVVNIQYNKIHVYDASITVNTESSEEEKTKLYDAVKNSSDITKYMNAYMASSDVSHNDAEQSVYLFVPETTKNLDSFVLFHDRVSKENYSLNNSGVILTEKLAKTLDVKKGDTIFVKDDDNKKVELKVDEVTENYINNYVYLTADLYKQKFNVAPEFNQILTVNKNADKAQQDKFTEDMLKNNAVSSVMFNDQIGSTMGDTLERLDVVIYVLIISAGLLAFIVLYNLNNINVNERQRELATIKVLGFYDNEVAEYIYRENIILTVVGSIFGIFFGIILHKFIITTVEMEAMMFGRNIKIMSFVYSILLTYLFSAVVNFVMYFKLKKIDMIESLKSIE